MTTISVRGSAPSSDRVEAVLDRLSDACPHVIAKRDHIASEDADAEGIHEARITKLANMRDEARDYENRAYHKQRDAERYGTLTDADADQIEKWLSRAKDIKLARQVIFEEKRPKRFTLEMLDRAIVSIQPHHDYVTHIPKVPDDPEKCIKQLQRVRDGRGDLIEIRRKIEFAPLPVEVAERLAKEQIAATAKKGRPNISELFRVQEHKGHNGCIRWADHFVHTRDGGRTEPDPWTTFVWLHEAVLTKRAVEMIRERAPEGAITLEERPAKLAEIDAQLEALEYEEEALICVLESTGRHRVERRHDASPYAVLQIKRGEDMERPKRAKKNYDHGGGSIGGVPVTDMKWAASAGKQSK